MKYFEDISFNVRGYIFAMGGEGGSCTKKFASLL